MDDLTAFITARLAEAHARATALQREARHAIEALKEPRLLGREIPGWHSWPDVEAMCLGMLRDIEAKRSIVARHERRELSGSMPYCNYCSSGDTIVAWPCDDIIDLVGVWSDHADAPEWARADHG